MDITRLNLTVGTPSANPNNPVLLDQVLTFTYGVSTDPDYLAIPPVTLTINGVQDWNDKLQIAIAQAGTYVDMMQSLPTGDLDISTATTTLQTDTQLQPATPSFATKIQNNLAKPNQLNP